MIYIDIQYIQDVQEKNNNNSENAPPLSNKIFKQLRQLDPKKSLPTP